MKNKLIVIVVLMFASVAKAQTGVDPSQIRCASASGIVMLVGVPVGGPSIALSCIQLDSSIVLDTTVTPPRLRVVSKTEVEEIPTGVIDGTNAVFKISAAPPSGIVHVYRNGLLQRRCIVAVGCNGDFTMDTTITTITFITPPAAGGMITAHYWK